MRPDFVRTRRAAAVFILALPAGAALAQALPALKPGLWEMRSTRTVDGKPALTAADGVRNLPPQLRVQVEASMKEKGFAMAPDGASRLCLTYDSFELIRGEGQGGCKTDYATRTARAWKWHSVCTQPGAEFDGEAAFTSPESYTANVTMTSANAKGARQKSVLDTKAKWLGADCAGLKPMAVPR